jgi:hypothetical protein
MSLETSFKFHFFGSFGGSTKRAAGGRGVESVTPATSKPVRPFFVYRSIWRPYMVGGVRDYET